MAIKVIPSRKSNGESELALDISSLRVGIIGWGHNLCFSLSPHLFSFNIYLYIMPNQAADQTNNAMERRMGWQKWVTDRNGPRR